MARPISLELPPRDPRQELRKRLDEAPIEHAEALLDSWELLQEPLPPNWRNLLPAR